MLRILTAALLFVSAFPAFAGTDCTCRHQETNIPEGAVICMRTPKGMQMAQCARVLNNTSWKFLGTPCPTTMRNHTATTELV